MNRARSSQKRWKYLSYWVLSKRVIFGNPQSNSPVPPCEQRVDFRAFFGILKKVQNEVVEELGVSHFVRP